MPVQFLLPVLSLSGLLLGWLIGHHTQEEVKKAGIYFRWLKIALLLGIAAFALQFSFSPLFFVLGLILAFLLPFPYFFFGVLLRVSYPWLGFLAFASLVFLYGLPEGSLLRMKKMLWKEIGMLLSLAAVGFLFGGFLPSTALSSAAAACFVLALMNYSKGPTWLSWRPRK